MYPIIDNDYEEDFEGNPEDIMMEYDNPGLGEILLAEPSNPLASKAMKRAGKLRREGMSASQALKEAWSTVRRGRSSNPEFEPSTLLVVLVLVGAGIGVFRLAKGCWPWEWKGLQLAKQQAIAHSRRIMAARQQQGQQLGSVIPVHQARDFQDETITLLVP